MTWAARTPPPRSEPAPYRFQPGAGRLPVVNVICPLLRQRRERGPLRRPRVGRVHSDRQRRTSLLLPEPIRATGQAVTRLSGRGGSRSTNGQDRGRDGQTRAERAEQPGPAHQGHERLKREASPSGRGYGPGGRRSGPGDRRRGSPGRLHEGQPNTLGGLQAGRRRSGRTPSRWLHRERLGGRAALRGGSPPVGGAHGSAC
jgi:hypothetical protein